MVVSRASFLLEEAEPDDVAAVAVALDRASGDEFTGNAQRRVRGQSRPLSEIRQPQRPVLVVERGQHGEGTLDEAAAGLLFHWVEIYPLGPVPVG